MVGEFLRDTAHGTSDREVRMSYYDPGDGKDHLQYEGIAKQGTDPATQEWVIRRMYWEPGPTDPTIYIITRIQVLKGIWDDRASLSWLP